MSDDRSRLEAQLLKQPFDYDLRVSYAELLRSENDWARALEQYELVLQGAPGRADAHVGAARCCVELNKREAALEFYGKARSLEGFEADETLDALMEAARAAKSHLHAVKDPPKAEVVVFEPRREEKVHFADVAGMDALKKTLRLQIIEPFLRPGLFSRFKKRAGGGVLLYGPPGCGKTLMARAIATECDASFISVGISDVLNMWIGESERNLSLVFEKARAGRPCVLFFDELDALAFSRSKAVSEHSRTVVNEFLSQLDGFDKDNEGVLILAATNMPWDVDPAMKRPGRFSKQIFVPPPDAEARTAMFEMKLSDIPTRELNCAALGQRAQYFSGADIDGVIDEAKDLVLADIITSNQERSLAQEDLEQAVESVAPSTLDWLKTARNLVKYAGADASYREVEKYLKKVKLV